MCCFCWRNSCQRRGTSCLRESFINVGGENTFISRRVFFCWLVFPWKPTDCAGHVINVERNSLNQTGGGDSDFKWCHTVAALCVWTYWLVSRARSSSDAICRLRFYTRVEITRFVRLLGAYYAVRRHCCGLTGSGIVIKGERTKQEEGVRRRYDRCAIAEEVNVSLCALKRNWL